MKYKKTLTTDLEHLMQEESSIALLEQAQSVLSKSYSPYSSFPVGAALLTKKGGVFVGTNVENISFGLSVCAERNAIASAISSEGPTMRIQAIAVTSSEAKACTPCGACRQCISEFGSSAHIILNTESGLASYTLSDLLPGRFSSFGTVQTG